MQHRLFFLTLLLNFVPYLSANPVDEFDLPAISEILWMDGKHWSIEIDGKVMFGIEREATYPSFRIYFASTHQMYELDLYFNESSLAVITQDSLLKTGNPPPSIQNYDTLFIPYQEGEASFPDEPGWLCVPDNLQRGRSLVSNYLEGKIVYYSTSRSSIGTRGDYSTTHTLQILDRDSLPLSGIGCTYQRRSKRIKIIFDSLGYAVGEVTSYVTDYIQTGVSDSNGLIKNKEAYIYWSGGETYYLSGKPLESFTEISFCKYPNWRVNYIDSHKEVTDTVVYKPNCHMITVVDNNGDPQPSLLPVAWYDPQTSGIPFGEPVDSGMFIYELFGDNSKRYIEFMTVSDSTVVAACSLLYTDTEDTVFHNLVATPVQNRSAPNKVLAHGQPATLTCRVTGRNTVKLIVVNRYRMRGTSFIDICSINGKTVASVPVALQQTGTHTVLWNGNGTAGAVAASGRYICRLLYNGKTIATRKVTLL